MNCVPVGQSFEFLVHLFLGNVNKELPPSDSPVGKSGGAFCYLITDVGRRSHPTVGSGIP